MAAPAVGTGKRKRKRGFSEDDVYLLLHRYTPSTILTALQEVAQHADRRDIDWRSLVGKTATGITSAREYQMLWRHCAYRHDLAENVDDGAQPLGDESDLECEVEPVPTPSNEALVEASTFAKILISGSSREQASSHRIHSEAPVLNTPNEKIPRVPSDKQLAQSHRLTNGTCPVSNSKQASHTGLSPDPLDANGPPKKKKKPKPWSKEEDAELAAGVQKCGEGNWLDILHKYSFDNTRTPVQLSQRWALICKRQGTTKPANTKPVSVASSEERKAAQKAFSMALDMPMTGLSTLRSGALQQSIQHPSPVFGTMTPEVRSATAPSSLPVPVPVPMPVAVPVPVPVPVPVQVQLPLSQVQQAPAQAAPLKVSNTSICLVQQAPAQAAPLKVSNTSICQVQQAPAQAAPLKVSNTSNKSRNNSKKQAAQPNPTNGPSSIQAAAIAAGGRIATPSVATNLFKAAQSTKAVHIRSRGTGSSKSSTSSKASTMAGEPGAQLGSAQHPEPPNTSAPASSPSVLTTHASEQVHDVSEVAGVNPPGLSAGMHLSETKRTLSTTPMSAPCNNVDKDDDSTFCVVTMEDLFPEEAKQPDIVDPKADEIIDPKDADMIEFDRFVAQGCLNMDYLDKSKTVKIAPGAQDVGSQKKQPKPLSAAGKSNPVSAGAPATGKKTKTPVPHGATSMKTGTSSGVVGTGNASVQDKAVGGKAAAPATTGSQNTCPEAPYRDLKR